MSAFKDRRRFLAYSSAAVLLTSTGLKFTDAMATTHPQLKELYSDHDNCNAVAVSSDGITFLGFPRFGKPYEAPQSVGRLEKSGKVTPFPNAEWNSWQPGKDPRNAFIAINTIHIFNDDTLWAVDQGARAGGKAQPGAQKVVQMDVHSGKILNIIRFNDELLPEGSAINDLRIHGDIMYLTDSGAGAIIVYNMKTHEGLRRLAGQAIVKNDAEHPLRGSGGHLLMNAKGQRTGSFCNQLEVDPSGKWFYFAPLVGPMRRVSTKDLRNPNLSEAELAKRVSEPFDIPSTNGTAMDDRGNFYVSDAEHNRILVISPEGKRTTLVQNSRLISPDALFIDHQRTLYIPCGQVQYTAGMNKGHYTPKLPFQVFTVKLPHTLDGIRLGSFLG